MPDAETVARHEGGTTVVLSAQVEPTETDGSGDAGGPNGPGDTGGPDGPREAGEA